jgi:peptidylprolyl isomerase
MRTLSAIAALLAGLTLFACGSGGDPPKPRIAMSKAEIAKLREPKVLVRGRPPNKLVARDLRKGTGALVKRSDTVLLDYVAASYKTGKVFEDTWTGAQARPSRFPLEEVIKGWEEGVPGMRVGGRRELLVPSKLAYGQGAVLYVIDLVEIDTSLGGRKLSR